MEETGKGRDVKEFINIMKKAARGQPKSF